MILAQSVHTESISVWTVFFMRKIIKLCMLALMMAGAFGLGGLLADKQALQEDVIRLHVIANSDSEKDQQIKLRVRDAIVSFLTPLTKGLDSKEKALSFLQDNLARIKQIANDTLVRIGVPYRADVKLTQEAYGTRQYDTFSLPAGVYDSLQIQIGDADGENWWCVVFPSLCLSATSQEFCEVAAASGFDDSLTQTLAREQEYEIRFFLLDCIGKLENFFH